MNIELEDRDDYLPISMLNQLAYCPRRFWLMYVCGEMEVNAPVLEGTMQHHVVHTGGNQSPDGETRRLRQVYVWSDRWRLIGFADLVEEDGDNVLQPVEYKHGRQGRWVNDQVQLCAQAMCLEERTGRVIEQGHIFYWASRRRVEVLFSPELRQETQALIATAHQMVTAGQLPPPLDHPPKCRDCSLESVCLPRETLVLVRE